MYLRWGHDCKTVPECRLCVQHSKLCVAQKVHKGSSWGVWTQALQHVEAGTPAWAQVWCHIQARRPWGQLTGIVISAGRKVYKLLKHMRSWYSNKDPSPHLYVDFWLLLVSSVLKRKQAYLFVQIYNMQFFTL